MSEDKSKSPQGWQATITAGLGTLATAACLKFIPADHAQFCVVIANLIVPVIAYFSAKWIATFDEPGELTQYKARLKRDLKNQKQVLEDAHASEELKDDVRKKYHETTLKLLTANQSYTSGGLVLED